jgi:hypothetical protein
MIEKNIVMNVVESLDDGYLNRQSAGVPVLSG